MATSTALSRACCAVIGHQMAAGCQQAVQTGWCTSGTQVSARGVSSSDGCCMHAAADVACCIESGTAQHVIARQQLCVSRYVGITMR
jgi:hypothetical protein